MPKYEDQSWNSACFISKEAHINSVKTLGAFVEMTLREGGHVIDSTWDYSSRDFPHYCWNFTILFPPLTPQPFGGPKPAAYSYDPDTNVGTTPSLFISYCQPDTFYKEYLYANILYRSVLRFTPPPPPGWTATWASKSRASSPLGIRPWRLAATNSRTQVGFEQEISLNIGEE